MSELVVGSLKGLAANNFEIEVASGSRIVQPGAILQVLSTTKSDTFTTTSTSFTDITGLEVTITPTSTSSKILVSYNVSGSQDVGSQLAHARLMRDSTAINIGDAAGSRTRSTSELFAGDSGIVGTTVSGTFLDSPSSTSATVYKVQLRTTGSTAFVNRGEADVDESFRSRTVSTITVMEVAG
jgi:hypothetical protein